MDRACCEILGISKIKHTFAASLCRKTINGNEKRLFQENIISGIQSISCIAPDSNGSGACFVENEHVRFEREAQESLLVRVYSSNSAWNGRGTPAETEA